jgi:photosystem II stability/assembly factor-like uncharacterized protein
MVAAVLLLLLSLVSDAHTASAHSPHDDVTDVAISPTYADDRTVLAIVRGKLMRSTDGGSTWSEVVRGVGGMTEALARVAIAPTDARVVYLTTRSDGVLKSEDGGTSWRPARRGLTNPSLQEIAVSPVSPDVALAAGGIGGGLFRTTDGGSSWSAVGGAEQITSLAFLPDGSRLVAGDAQGRITTFSDGGATRERVVRLGGNDAVTAVATGSTADSADIVFAATASGRVFRSDDGGQSFEPRDDGLPHEEVRSVELSPHHSRDTTVWVSTWDSGVFRSTDDGETWEPMNDGLTTDPSADVVGLPHFRTVAATVDDSGHTSLFVGGYDGIFRSDDRGTWDSVETLSDYVVGLAVSPDFGTDHTVAVTTYVKGAFVSDDRGETWRSANDGLVVDGLTSGNRFAPLRRLHNVVFSPDYANDGTIFTAYGVAILKSTDRGASWKQIIVSPEPPGGDLRQFVIAVSPSYASDRTVFVGTRQGEIFRSEQSGETGTWVQAGRFGVDERVRSLAVSPDYPRDRVLYAGTVAGVYTSADGGATWDATGPRMAATPEQLGTDEGALVAISPAYDRDGTVFAGTDSGLFVTRDAGQSWTEVTTAPLAASSEIEAVAVSPAYPADGTVLASTRDDGLLRSTDGGRSFRPIGTALLDANHLVADFSNSTASPIQFSPGFASDRTIFAYAQTDVLRSTDGGDSWEILRLPSRDDVLEALESGSDGAASAEGQDERWFETPIGNLSVRRVVAAALAGVAAFGALWVVGVGGRRTGQGLVLRLGGGLIVVAVALLVLAA